MEVCSCLDKDNEKITMLENAAMQFVEMIRSTCAGMCVDAQDHFVGLLVSGLSYDAIVRRTPDMLHNDVMLVSANEAYAAALAKRVQRHMFEYTATEKGKKHVSH